jgi:hypothetical protein
MSSIEKQFDYKSEAGPLKLLGVLCIVLAPLAMWMSFQEDPNPDGLWMLGRGWFAYVPAPLVPWVIRAFSLLLVWIGVVMIKGAGEQQKYGGRIAFTPVGLIYEAGKPDGIDRAIKYQDITDIQIADKGNKSALYFKHIGEGKRFIAAASMKSKAEFDEMAAMLQQRVKEAGN